MTNTLCDLMPHSVELVINPKRPHGWQASVAAHLVQSSGDEQGTPSTSANRWRRPPAKSSFTTPVFCALDELGCERPSSGRRDEPRLHELSLVLEWKHWDSRNR